MSRPAERAPSRAGPLGGMPPPPPTPRGLFAPTPPGSSSLGYRGTPRSHSSVSSSHPEARMTESPTPTVPNRLRNNVRLQPRTPRAGHAAAMATLPDVLDRASVIATSHFAPKDILTLGMHAAHWRVMHAADEETFVREVARLRDAFEVGPVWADRTVFADCFPRSRESLNGAASA